jgi:adenylate cyclase
MRERATVTEAVPLSETARRAGVTPQTLRRWAREGLVPQLRDGLWTPAAIAQARVVARLRERGHTLDEIRAATESGRLAFSFVDELLPEDEVRYTVAEVAAETGLEPALIERVYLSMGFNAATLQRLTAEDVELLRYVAVVLSAGFPLVALLQLVRVYGQALAQMADAEVRLFHLYIHEPLMRAGVPGVQMAAQMHELAQELLPMASPVMDRVHRRFLTHFVEQDIVGHMEADLDDGALDLGRLRVAIVFADLAGYTRLTEEAGDEQAVDAVERFIEGVEVTLPEEARVVKTIGDEVMVVGSDPAALVDWAVGFQKLVADRRPLPRIGLHYGLTLYRDGDYYGREVNIAARVAARAAGGEVLVTSPVVELAGAHLEFERIGEVRLKGFREATELFVAREIDDDG